MKQFTNNNIDLGTIKVGSKHIVRFQGNVNLSTHVYKLSSSCSCTQPKIKANAVEVVFKAKPIPKHLVSQGYYQTSATITVTFNSGIKEILYINAKVVRYGLSF